MILFLYILLGISSSFTPFIGANNLYQANQGLTSSYSPRLSTLPSSSQALYDGPKSTENLSASSAKPSQFSADRNAESPKLRNNKHEEIVPSANSANTYKDMNIKDKDEEMKSPSASSANYTKDNTISKGAKATVYRQGDWYSFRYWHNNNRNPYWPADSPKPPADPTWPTPPAATWPHSHWPKPTTWRHWPAPRNQTGTWQRSHWPNQPDNGTRNDRWQHGYYWPGHPRGTSTSAWPPLPARATPPCEEAAAPDQPHRWPRRFSPHF